MVETAKHAIMCKEQIFGFDILGPFPDLDKNPDRPRRNREIIPELSITNNSGPAGAVLFFCVVCQNNRRLSMRSVCVYGQQSFALCTVHTKHTCAFCRCMTKPWHFIQQSHFSIQETLAHQFTRVIKIDVEKQLQKFVKQTTVSTLFVFSSTYRRGRSNLKYLSPRKSSIHLCYKICSLLACSVAVITCCCYVYSCSSGSYSSYECKSCNCEGCGAFL